MKIKQVHVRASKIKLKETFTIALGTIESADSAIVEIETEEGLVGYGEGGPGIFITGETLAGTIETIELFGQAIIGLNPFNIEKIHEVMDKISAFAPAAKAAIDTTFASMTKGVLQITNSSSILLLERIPFFFMLVPSNWPVPLQEKA